MNHVAHPLSSIILPEISKFCFIKKYRYRLHIDTYFLILLTYLSLLNISLINIVAILVMSAKMATLGILKIKLFWNKVYNVIIYVDDVTNQILSRDSNYIIDMVIWPKFGNSSIYMIEATITSFYMDLTRKTTFFKGKSSSWIGLSYC